MNRLSVNALSKSLNELSFGFALLDSHFVIQDLNPRFSSIMQKDIEMLRQKRLIDCFPEFSVFQFNEPHEFQRISRNNGQSLAVDLFRFDDFSHSFFWIFCRDSTNYRQLQYQFDQQTEQIMLDLQMFNVLFDGIFICDGHGKCLFVNDAFLQLSGLNREDVINKSVYELIEKKIVPNACSAKVLETRAPASTINNYYQGRSCLVSGTPVFNNQELVRVVSVVRDVTELQKLTDAVANADSLSLSYRHQLKELEIKSEHNDIINTRSKVMKNIYDTAIKAAAVDSHVLILGETGVGKDHLAKFIHNIRASHVDGCFINVNCNAIPPTLIESELFGYEPGAFSGANRSGKAGLLELAQNGTLYLDEIGDLPLSIQVKLLHAIQEHSFFRVGGTKTVHMKARIIAATNADLEKLIAEGKFRSDLYYRISVIVIRIPPLRLRRDDVIPLALHLLENSNTHYKKHRYFSPKTIEFILNYDWPGNIREMMNVIERMVVMCDQDCIEPTHLGDDLLRQVKVTDYANLGVNAASSSKLSLRQRLDEYEAAILEESIHSHKTLKEAALTLGIDLSTLVRKQQKFNSNAKRSLSKRKSPTTI
ncbi:MAG: sigma 54-interacting transcriptional regulator [Negativicutes bacterium]